MTRGELTDYTEVEEKTATASNFKPSKEGDLITLMRQSANFISASGGNTSNLHIPNCHLENIAVTSFSQWENVHVHYFSNT